MSQSPLFASLTLNPTLYKTRQSATLAINERSQTLLKQGKNVFRLGLGQSPFPVPNLMVDALKTAAPIKDYLAVQGLEPLREAIADYLQRTESVRFNARQMIIGPGTKELMFILQNVLNTDLLLPAPSWVSYQPQAILCRLKCHWVPCSIENKWKITADDLEQAILQHPNAKLLILNSPNNPSGACFEEDELKALAAIAKKHSIIVLSDEIYSALHFEQKHQSLARYYPEGTIISNGISKWSGAGGWRLGFMAVPKSLKPVLTGMITFASETYTSVSAPIQYAAIKAFEASPELEDYTHATRKIMQFVTHTFHQKLLQMNLACPKPEGGFYLLCQFGHYKEALLKKGIRTSAELSEHLLNDVGVACLPGNDFGLSPESLSIRMALVDFNGANSLDDYNKLGEGSFSANNPTYRHLFSAADQLGSWLNQL